MPSGGEIVLPKILSAMPPELAHRERLVAAAGLEARRTCRCRRSSGPRRRGRPSRTRTPCSSRSPVENWPSCDLRCRRSAGRRSSRTWRPGRPAAAAAAVASMTFARSAVAGSSSLDEALSSSGPSSLRVCATHGNAASIVAAVSLTPGRISRAKARVFGNEAFSASSALLAFTSVGPSRRIEALQVGRLATRRPPSSVEVRDQVLELVLVARPGPRSSGSARRSAARGRGPGCPGRRRRRPRVPRRRALAVADGVVERLGAVSPRALGSGVQRPAPRRLVGQRRSPSPSSSLLQVRARVALQRGQHLVELHRGRASG